MGVVTTVVIGVLVVIVKLRKTTCSLSRFYKRFFSVDEVVAEAEEEKYAVVFFLRRCHAPL